MTTFARLLFSTLFLFVATPGVAQERAPEELVKSVTEEVLAILRDDRQIQSGDTKRAAELIETRIAPHFDFPRITALAVGRAWGQADASQRAALTEEFRKLLVRTYANSLTRYREQTVTFKPLRPGTDANEVMVSSQINQPGGQPVALDYRLSRTPNGWKVIDVAVANVSLVTSYRSSFASEVRSGGVDGLLKALQAKNRDVQTPATSPTPG
ncbi:MAG: ABC transporter substrate-binding protein [Aromatoleum sp.]|jgi:phospholipid transport system substrate-binding protein|uniref:MlaC/ttg2D family ABC transporter substrate-binding protein n=1 Tax=Aromatoleum sp. TaxID=2307007 RepID=UPI0028947F25|nr:ABC transporter substrate-binding protein [Aromatoleum sp.]MDT3672460.1 ABC transporter substrate-binding protein [Aromatoleum sp.]